MISDPPVIDVNFDFRSDTPGYGKPGVDPDKSSPRLRECHQLLWSKPLPSGAPFRLDMIGQPDGPGWKYLYHRSDLGEFRLHSDAVVPGWARWKRMAHIIALIPPAEIESFDRIGYTIGAMMVWPGNPVNGKGTINQDRGCNTRIDDRFDLTVECVRRHYLGAANPLSDTLARYSEFFKLFGSFAGWVEFFHLHDLVDEAASKVKFFMPFDGFRGRRGPRPSTPISRTASTRRSSWKRATGGSTPSSARATDRGGVPRIRPSPPSKFPGTHIGTHES